MKKNNARDFNANMNKLFSLVRHYFNLAENLTDYFYNIKTEKYEFDENMMFYFLYDICNYDMIRISGDAIDIQGSNHEDIATLLAPWASKENCKKVAERLYN